MDAPANEDWYIRKLEIATGAHIRRSHGRNLPSFFGCIRSTILPIVTSVNASMHRAVRNKVPTSPMLIPNTFV